MKQGLGELPKDRRRLEPKGMAGLALLQRGQQVLLRAACVAAPRGPSGEVRPGRVGQAQQGSRSSRRPGGPRWSAAPLVKRRVPSFPILGLQSMAMRHG